MAKASAIDEFTFTKQAEPCAIVREVGARGLSEAFDHAIEQIIEHRRLHGARSGGGPNASWLKDKLADKDIHVDVQMLRRHIKRDCSCGRAES